MDNKPQHSNSPAENRDRQHNEHPGYPHHSADQDITNSGAEQVRLNNMENSEEQRGPLPGTPQTTDKSEDSNDADVTDEDLAILTATTQNRDMDDPDIEAPKLDNTDDDGDPLNEPQSFYNAAGADLDVPGSETDDANENIGEEDEENNYYSLGGDNHEHLEEDNTSV